MLSSQEEQAERRRVALQDASLREQQQGGTFHQHAVAEASTPLGRFGAIANAQVVGATAIPSYPAAAAHQSDPCGPEPALGYSVDALEPSAASLAEQTDAPAHAASPASSASPAPGPVSSAASGASPFSQTSGDPATEVPFPTSARDGYAVGSPPLRRRRM